MAFRDLFHNYFYGKSDRRDFTEADLPGNRVQLFFQVLGVRRGQMMGLNLVYLLIWLPAIIWTVLNIMTLNGMLNAQAAPEEYRQLIFTWTLLLWPCVALTGPFNVGISYVMHLWAQDEHAYPFMDFGLGMKQNWKQGLLFSVIDGAVPLLVFICADFYHQLSQNSALFMLPLAITLIMAFLWFLASPLVPQLIVSYRQSIWGILRNAVLMALAQLPRSVGMRLLTLIVPLIAAVSLIFFPGALQWIVLIACILYALILLALNKLLWASYSNYLGEKYLNARIPGAPVNRGLRPDHKEDDADYGDHEVSVANSAAEVGSNTDEEGVVALTEAQAEDAVRMAWDDNATGSDLSGDVK